MKHCLIFLIVFVVLCCCALPARADNPFSGHAGNKQESSAPSLKDRFLVKIVVWQHQLKQKMSALIRQAKTGQNIRPLLLLLILAFVYGTLHAAGPGHGKLVAGSYALSHPVSLAKGILFAFFLAFFHGFTGALCVIALNFIIQQSVSHTLGTVTTVTQIISFGLIFLLGVGIFLKNSAPLILKRFSRQDKSQNNESAKGLLAWAATLGLVPCPAVVMVMLFCLSMDVLILGVLLAVCISLGMAVTISTVMIAVIFGKTGVLQSLLKNHAQIAETVIGLISGAAIAVFGLIFLIAAI